MSEWLSKIPEAKIDCTSKAVTNLLRKGKQTLKLRPGRRLVSYDVESLYTNVPVTESINLAAEKLYSMAEVPPVDKETFKTLAHLCCSDVILVNNNGVYIQKEGLAMGCNPRLCWQTFGYLNLMIRSSVTVTYIFVIWMTF